MEKVIIETEKVNKLLKYIPTDDINEQNKFIYVGAKLTGDKIDIPPPKKSVQELKILMGKGDRRANKEVVTTSKTAKIDKTHINQKK